MRCSIRALAERLVRTIAAPLALLVLPASPAWAQSQQPLSLHESAQLALARSGQLTAQEASARAAQHMAVAAGQLPDPVLKLGVDNLPVNGPDRLSLNQDFMTMRRIGLMQELPGRDKRRLRAERYERDADVAQAQRQLAATELRSGTAMAWLEAHYAQSMRKLLLRQQDEARLQEQGAAIAYREGRGAQADVFAARTALVEAEDRLSEVDRQARGARILLARWVGADAERPLAGLPALDLAKGHTAPDMPLTSAQLESYPQLRVLAARLRAAETELRLAQANTQPDWTVEAAYQQRGPSFSDMVSIGVSIPLQWDRKNRQGREIAAKAAQVDEARANYEELQRAYAAEVGALRNDWQTARQRVARYEQQMIPLAAQRAAAALTSYRVGKGDLASVLAARQAEVNARAETLRLELEAARLWAQLNYLDPEVTAADELARSTSTSTSTSSATSAPSTLSKGQP